MKKEMKNQCGGVEGQGPVKTPNSSPEYPRELASGPSTTVAPPPGKASGNVEAQTVADQGNNQQANLSKDREPQKPEFTD